MRFSQFAGTLAAAAISLTAMTGIAQAQQVTFAGATGVGNTVFTYSGANGGGFAVTPGSQFFASDLFPPTFSTTTATLDFAPGSFLNEGVLTTGSGSDLIQNLSGGAFTLREVGTNTLLLSGTITDANLFGTVGQSNGSFRVAQGDIVYTGGTYFTSGLQNPGEFSFGLTGVTPAFSGAVGGRFNNFTSGGTGTFSATAPNPVPEPSEWMAMGMAATSVGGLMFRARRRKVSKTAA